MVEHANGLFACDEYHSCCEIDKAIELGKLQIGKSAVHNFITKDMGFTFKRAAFHSLKRNDEGNIEARYEWAKQVAETDKSFPRSCVFIDESGFHISMNRSRAWAPKGETPIVKKKAKNTRAVSHTILSAMTAYAVVIAP